MLPVVSDEAAAFDDGLLWLRELICDTPDAAVHATLLADYQSAQPLFIAQKSVGPPSAERLETGACDGEKTNEGLNNMRTRRGHFLGEGRLQLGVLAAPTRVILRGARSGHAHTHWHNLSVA